MKHLHIFLLFSLLVLRGENLSAQQTFAPHQIQQQEFGNNEEMSEREWDDLNRGRGIVCAPPQTAPLFPKVNLADTCPLDRIVFGWHPYWVGTAYENYDYSVLSDLSYFSYEVDPNTGNYKNIHSWKTTDLVTRAKAAGRRVNLCVTLFSGHATFFGNPDAKRTLIDSLIALVRLRDADGVNIDFESIAGSQRDNLTGFMKELGQRFHTEIPGSQISMALPAVDWQKTFDVIGMQPYVDLFIIMGYAFHYSGSTNAGPNAPKNNGSFWSAYDLTRSVEYYLDLGLPSQQLCLGLPWYGQSWATVSDQLGAATQGQGSAVFYSGVRKDLDTNNRNRQWDVHSSTPWYAFEVLPGAWKQTWYDDAESLGMKYDLAIMKDLAGVGIWALGYDGGYPEMWETLRDRFADCGATPCSDEITDMGGPTGNYPANDTWHYTIAPEGATSISLEFSQFDLADDHLLVYEGSDENAPLIANLTGAGAGEPITAKSGEMTLRFVSNGSQQGTGFIGTWNCSTIPLSVALESEEGFSVSLYPNPNGGRGRIVFNLKRETEITGTLVDASGREIEQIVRMLPEGRSLVDLEELVSPSLPDGIYLLQLRGEDGEEQTISLIVRKN